MNLLKPENFQRTIDSKSTDLFTLSNANGVKVSFTNYGQRLVSLYVPDAQGNFEDVVMGYASLEEYLNSPEKYFGAVIGRYGNRIANGELHIEGKGFKLATNNGPNHLHGGNKGFESLVWDVKQDSHKELEFSRISVDGEEGYPGNLKVSVTYTLTEKNDLEISYTATTDKTTVVNLTHHSYFNLHGDNGGSINDHILMINADSITPIDQNSIPTGAVDLVEGTPFDFRTAKAIGQDIDTDSIQLKYGSGYDHNFVLNKAPTNEKGLTLAARVIEPRSGRVMEVFTDEPGMQFYSGNFIDGSTVGKSGKAYHYRGAFCLETQHFPDAPNQPNFPSTILHPGEIYHSNCVYSFRINAS